MWRWILGPLFVIACTKPNPRSCADGVCSDPSFPFCDVDGAFDGIPDQCIAVECMPGAFETCRGNDALRCNSTGNDFEVVECQLACESGANGCVKCTSNDQCSNPLPVCDEEIGECRGCLSDRDCSSQVCDAESGTCLSETEVVYASPTGSGSASCSAGEPCSIARAVMLAGSNPLRSTVRLLPGLYTTGVEVRGGNRITIVAEGATFESAAGFRVLVGADVIVRGGSLKLSGELRCDGDPPSGTPVTATLRTRDLTIDLDATGAILNNCNFEARRTTVVFTGTGDFSLANRVTLDVAQSRFSNPSRQSELVFAGGTRANLRVVNSVFEDVVFGTAASDATPGQSSLLFAFNTIVVGNTPSPSALDCGGNGTVRIENNIVVREPAGNRDAVALSGTCVAANNIFFPQAAPIGGNNLIQDPLLVDAANRDVHLQAGSPAIDTAIPSTGLDPDDDFEGTPRPQGDARDVGAFERMP